MSATDGGRFVRRSGRASIGFAALVLFAGVFRAFERGGQDFAVFHHAWNLVLAGEGARIYVDSPDRYLYAPGFAWLFSPLGLIPFDWAFGFWTAAKVMAAAWLVWVVGHFAQGARTGRSWMLAALGLCMIARPLIIDFRYGQINFFLLVAAVAAVLPGLRGDSSRRAVTVIQWAVLAVLGAGKLLVAPLLAIPFVTGMAKSAGRLRMERLGVLLGLLIVGSAPVVSEGLAGTVELYRGWLAALQAKGLPLDSHNQSFLAFLHHYFSGNPTPVIAAGRALFEFGGEYLSLEQIRLLGVGWLLLMLGVLLALLVNGPGRGRASGLSWLAWVTGLLIVPSHLVWKPYFVFSFVPAVLAARNVVGGWVRGRHLGGILLWILLFGLMNLSGFDWIGMEWHARLEAASVFLMVHFALMVMVYRKS